MKDNEGDNEDFAIDMEFVINSDTNVVNLKKTNKGVRVTTFALPNAIRKGVSDADNSA